MSPERYKAIIDMIRHDDTDEWKYETNKLSYNDSIYKSYEDENYSGRKESEIMNGLSEEAMNKLKQVLTDEELFIFLKHKVDVDIDMKKRKKVREMSFREIGELLPEKKSKQRVEEIYEYAIYKLLHNYTVDDFTSIPLNCYPPKRASMGWLSDFYTNRTPCQLKRYINNSFKDNNTHCPGAFDRVRKNQLICGKVCCNKTVQAGLNVAACMKLLNKGRTMIENYFETGRLPGRKVSNGNTKKTWETTGEPITQCNEMVFDSRIHSFDKDKHVWWEIEDMKNKVLFAKSQSYQPKPDYNKALRLRKELLQRMHDILESTIEKSFDKAI